MPSSHPPTLLKITERTLREECDLERTRRVLAAVSGGPDSMALLDVLSRLRAKLGFELCAHGVDHGLRSEAAAELELAARYAKKLDVEFSLTKLTVLPGGNLQARARAARWKALTEAAQGIGADSIATGHHADDRAETVLMRILRGTGPRGLAVLRPKEGVRLRPLIRARKSDITLHLERHQIPYAKDPSNLDTRFLRVRVRSEVMPLLERISPGVVGHLNALADAAEDTSEMEPLRAAARDARVNLSRAHLVALSRARRLGGPRTAVRLPGGWEARIDPNSGELLLGLARPRNKR